MQREIREKIIHNHVHIFRHITRNDINFVRDAYELMQNDARYSLRLKTVSYRKNNGKYYCTILDKENGSQETASANVVVLG